MLYHSIKRKEEKIGKTIKKDYLKKKFLNYINLYLLKS